MPPLNTPCTAILFSAVFSNIALGAGCQSVDILEPTASTTLPSTSDSLAALFEFLPRTSSATVPDVARKIRALHRRDPLLVDKILDVIDERSDAERVRLMEALAVIGPDAAKAVPTMFRLEREYLERLRATNPDISPVPGHTISLLRVMRLDQADIVRELERMIREGDAVEAEAGILSMAMIRGNSRVAIEAVERRMRQTPHDSEFLQFLSLAESIRPGYLRNPPRDVRERLLRATADENPAAALLAARLTMMLDLPEEQRITHAVSAVASVLSYLSDPDAEKEGGGSGLLAVREFRIEDGSSPALLRELKDESAYRRGAAGLLAAFSFSPAPKRVELVAPLLDDPDPVVRRSAVYGLAAIGGEAAAVTAPKLEQIRQTDPNQDVREEAASALRSLHGRP